MWGINVLHKRNVQKVGEMYGYVEELKESTEVKAGGKDQSAPCLLDCMEDSLP